MEFSGEELIAKRIQAERQINYTIEHDILIAGVPYSFERCELFDNQLSMVLPQSFEDMDMEAAKFKYPSESRPQIIKCSSDGSVSLGIGKTNVATEKDEVKNRLNEMYSVIKRMNPAFVFGKQERCDIGEKMELSWFDFISYAIDMDIFNVIFVFNFEGIAAVGTFNCPAEIKKDWHPIAIQMIKSIKNQMDRTLEEDA